MNKNLLIGAGVFVAVVVVGSLVIGKPKVSPQPQNTPGAASGATSTPFEVREITVSANEYSFNPSTITLNKGEKVRLTFTNVGTMPHNLTIDELGVSTKPVARGKSDVAEFTAGESGTFNFYCNISNHRDLGMEGEVKVK